MPDVKAVVHDLLSQVEAAKARITEIDRQRAEVSLAALGDGDASAKRQLAQLHKDRAAAQAELEDFEAAVVAARQRAVAALEAEAKESERQRAAKAEVVVQRLAARGPIMDRAVATYVENFKAIQNDLTELSRLGVPVPSRELIAVNSNLAHDSALTSLGDKFVRPVPPTKRRTFDFLLKQWLLPATRWIESRLNNKPAKAAA